MMKSIGKSLIIAGTILSSAVILPQVSLAIGLTNLDPGDFTLDTGATPSGVIDVASLSGGILNTTALDTGNSRTAAGQSGFGGFGNFFGGNFLAIGGLGSETIGDSTRGINTRANSAVFALTGAALALGLQVSFDYRFAGYIGAAGPSTFLVQLADGVGPLANRLTFTTIALNNQGVGFSGLFNEASATAFTSTLTAAQLAPFAPGNFFVSINVDEPSSAGATNTVAGFRNITIEAIPFDFEPSLGIGLLGLGFGLNKVRKNWKAKKNTEV